MLRQFLPPLYLPMLINVTTSQSYDWKDVAWDCFVWLLHHIVTSDCWCINSLDLYCWSVFRSDSNTLVLHINTVHYSKFLTADIDQVPCGSWHSSREAIIKTVIGWWSVVGCKYCGKIYGRIEEKILPHFSFHTSKIIGSDFL